MNIFKYRYLALGCLCFILCLPLMYFISTWLRIALLISVLLAFVALGIYCYKKRGERSKELVVRFTPIAFFVALALVLSLACFSRDELLEEKYAGKENVLITATVEEVVYSEGYLGTYLVDVDTIAEESVSFRIVADIPKIKLAYGDKISMLATTLPLATSSIGFDEREAYLDKGIILCAEATECEKISNEASPIIKWLKDINTTLTDRFSKNLSEDTASLMSALLLGNKENLSPSVERDFSRLGISHILALSGMHLAIITMLLELLLRITTIKNRVIYILICICTLAFTAITGFIISCVRAALMVIIFHVFKFFGRRIDTITLLLLSVTLICIFSPYSIFSLSLQLSFLALLGCILSSRIIKAVRFLRRTPTKPLRYVVFTFITTLVVSLCTLPILVFKVGSIPILAPLLNIIVVPIFNFLVYVALAHLCLCDVSYLGNFVGWVCDFITEKTMWLISFFSNIDGILVPVQNVIQYLGILVCAIALILFAILGKKYRKRLIATGVIGIAIIFAGSAFIYIDRASNTYVGAYNTSMRDFVYIEEQNQLTIIDMSQSTKSTANRAVELSRHLGYGEIQRYVITDLSKQSIEHFQRISEKTILRSIYLPEGLSDFEKESRLQIVALAEKQGICVYQLESTGNLGGVELEICLNDAIHRSERRCTYFKLTKNGQVITYLAPSSYELVDTRPEKWAYESDLLILGEYGPVPREKAHFTTPYLDLCILLGDSYEHVSYEYVNSLKDYLRIDGDLPVRVRLEK